MRQITFTITEQEIKEVAKDNFLGIKLSREKINLILSFVESDEMLWEDINSSIISAIEETISS